LHCYSLCLFLFILFIVLVLVLLTLASHFAFSGGLFLDREFAFTIFFFHCCGVTQLLFPSHLLDWIVFRAAEQCSLDPYWVTCILDSGEHWYLVMKSPGSRLFWLAFPSWPTAGSFFVCCPGVLLKAMLSVNQAK
jgi:hypothetical protein